MISAQEWFFFILKLKIFTYSFYSNYIALVFLKFFFILFVKSLFKSCFFFPRISYFTVYHRKSFIYIYFSSLPCKLKGKAVCPLNMTHQWLRISSLVSQINVENIKSKIKYDNRSILFIIVLTFNFCILK